MDRGKYGSKIHLITERTGLPISVGISAANLHDSQALIPLVKGIPPIRSRRGPRRRKPSKLHGDKGYDYSHLRRWLRERGITHRIARKGVESSQRLGRHRWTIERTVAWLAGCRRLHRRYERKAEHFLAFTSIACTLICYRRLTSSFVEALPDERIRVTSPRQAVPQRILKDRMLGAAPAHAGTAGSGRRRDDAGRPRPVQHH